MLHNLPIPSRIPPEIGLALSKALSREASYKAESKGRIYVRAMDSDFDGVKIVGFTSCRGVLISHDRLCKWNRYIDYNRVKGLNEELIRIDISTPISYKSCSKRKGDRGYRVRESRRCINVTTGQLCGQSSTEARAERAKEYQEA